MVVELCEGVVLVGREGGISFAKKIRTRFGKNGSVRKTEDEHVLEAAHSWKQDEACNPIFVLREKEEKERESFGFRNRGRNEDLYDLEKKEKQQWGARF